MSSKRVGRTIAFIVLGAILLVVGLSVLAQALISPRKGSGPAEVLPSSATDLLRAVDNAQLCAHGATGHYISNLADLDLLSRGLIGSATRAHLAVQVSVGQSGQNYLARVTGHNVDTYLERRPGFIDYDDMTRVSNRCPYPLSTAKRRLRTG